MKTLRNMIAILSMTMLLSACFGGDPEDITVRIDSPPTVNRGEEFIIRFIAENSANKEQSIVSLDIDNSYFEGIYVNHMEPDSDEIYDIPLVDMKSFSFDVPIPPGESREVVFYVTALMEGDFQGDVDFCINRDTSYLTKSIRTVVGTGEGSRTEGSKK